MKIHDAPTQRSGPSNAALGSPQGMPHAPRSVGPVGLVAHILPFEVGPGELPVDADVRCHPHIGLVAVSFLLQGSVTHRDSLGNRHEIHPGGVGWTHSGAGVVHSERMERLRLLGGSYEMLQILLALPDGHEDGPPAFFSLTPEEVPTRVVDGATIRSLGGPATSIPFPGRLILEDVVLEPGGRYRVPDGEERAIYVLHGEVRIDGQTVRAQQTARSEADEPLEAHADRPTRILGFGGDAIGPRYMWWNFIHSSREQIEAARERWRRGAFTLPPGDTESFTPAPPDDGRPLLRLNPPTEDAP